MISETVRRVDDLSFFDYLSSFCFLSIEFHCTFSISYEMEKVLTKGHTRRACVENMKCGEVGRSRVWRRSRKSSEIW